VLLVDDLIATGPTLARACRALISAGASRVIVAAAHGQFLERAADLLDAAGIDALLVTGEHPFASAAQRCCHHVKPGQSHCHAVHIVDRRGSCPYRLVEHPCARQTSHHQCPVGDGRLARRGR